MTRTQNPNRCAMRLPCVGIVKIREVAADPNHDEPTPFAMQINMSAQKDVNMGMVIWKRSAVMLVHAP
jgi:hypothetical protein